MNRINKFQEPDAMQFWYSEYLLQSHLLKIFFEKEFESIIKQYEKETDEKTNQDQ